ncbi:uncharacterized protein N7459_003236 [Penicillium hispanicum]|uniref:uncharacterized protein n=1 Tax=Penicillium hispanicum TaxID=1080232 RepID=UPI002540DECF|nr:uncharacterized protein N7459_003236 [Penicillium hispanicum]KAJ5587471.1 hypothetical protein N7459_003236 [Penicillium hispanicum]
MTVSPPASPTTGPAPRPISAVMRTPRSSSRMSMSSRHGGSRASDEDGKTAVKVGMSPPPLKRTQPRCRARTTTAAMTMAPPDWIPAPKSPGPKQLTCRIAVRVRPPLKPTDPGYELIPQRFQRSMVHVTAPTSLAVDVPQGRKLFVFDRVFPETVDQDGIWEYLSDSVNSFLQGYNVSILAYGQSGAGKSYTMGTSGPNEQSQVEAMGIIPRAAQLLFEKLDGPNKHNRNGSSSTGLRTPQRYSMSSASSFGKPYEKNWQLKATYVEIYNEQLRDLLLPDSTPVNDRSTVSIREDAKGRIILTGLHQVNINSFDDLIGALNFGSAIRQTDSTAINAKSSRSHAVFSLNLVQRKSSAQPTSPKEKRMSMPVDSFSNGDSVTVDSKLHFVDLAGSERLKNTGASGERAREGISINAGLAALGKVISQLSSRQSGSHVSYRDSKLTRLLQDSLGGSAITYMIACVTPAEFHLSETLNTVQYAQRARAIQSKPRIQQVADESDKHALIERLKAEVAFLRQQIRNSEGSERREAASTERSERKNEREIQLQNQLLDVQESYNALSQRHTKLISTLASDSEATNGDADDATVDLSKNSIERMQRSRSFAESVEQVVLEYEKTIQSLEASLSNTRSSLASTESILLERETKCTYVETVNAQLQSRVQKLLDRDASNETYLHELESKLDGASTGEEKHAAIVAELRKELTRARDNESGCEEYISTLEDRLAEADQDMELMQREVIRLEHVIQRQRGLGNLDHLLHDLDTRHKSNDDQLDATNGIHAYHPPAPLKFPHRHTPSLDVLNEAVETAIPESDEDLAEPIPEEDESVVEVKESPQSASDDLEVLETVTNKLEARRSEALREEPATSPAQSKFVADKLETVTQELFDLRLHHETTLGDYELLEAKYEEALKAIAELRQDKIDETRHPAPVVQNEASRPVSFLEDGNAPTSKPGAQHSFSQSLSSELSSAGESAVLRDSSNISRQGNVSEPVTPVTSTATAQPDEDVEKMRRMLAEHEEGASLMAQKYSELETEHEEILGLVEKLKAQAEAQRTKTSSPTTPGFKMIRRMTSQNILSGVDRAHRSLTALRTIANEEFVDKPETMQNFEGHLDATMHELSTRMDRLQSLEAENQSVKKEMEMKATIISGLTRERSSLQGASSVDMALVTQLRDQVVAQENQINELREAHETRERQLLAEIETLSGLLKSQEIATRAMDAGAEEQDKKIDTLEGELSEWKGKHQSALGSLQSSEKQLATTLAELETALASVEAMRSERASSDDAAAEKGVAAEQLETERAKQQELVDGLKKDIEAHRTTITTQLETIAGLEKSHSAVQEQLAAQQADKEAGTRSAEIDSTRISELEQEISTHRSVIDSHKADLESLQETHRRELVELEQRAKAAAQAEHESRLAEKDAQHDQSMASLQKDIADSRDELVKLLNAVSSLLNSDVTTETLADQIQDVLAQKQHFSDKYAELMDTNEDLRKQIDAKGAQNDDLEELTKKSTVQDAKVNELALLVATLEDALRQKDEQVKKKEALVEEITIEKQKSVRLVEELEEQITNSFDQHHNRLSVIQQERDQALEDAKAKIVVLENDIDTYRVRIEQLELQLKNGTSEGSHDRSSSLTSNLRKSSSAASLPSPPPAIPLPPLPSIASQSNGTNSVSPPSSRHASKELVNAQLVEDQEARIRTIEKHLYAEKQLTATLEEALGDLEAQSSKVKTDCEGWKKKAWQLEDELSTLRKERNSARLSLQAVEEERSARREAEAARAQLEERMNALNKKKKKSTLNCF